MTRRLFGDGARSSPSEPAASIRVRWAPGRAGAKSVSREGTFAEDVSDVETLRATLRGFAESVGAELRRIGKRAKTVQLKLRYGDFSTISRSHTIERPTHSDEVLYETGVLLRSGAGPGPARRAIGRARRDGPG